MTTKPSTTRTTALLTAIALTITSCSYLNNDDTTNNSPLSEHLGFERLDLGFQTATDIQQQIEADTETQQQAIVECMENQGFTYTPITHPEPETTLPDPNTREYAETYGFGITTQAFSQQQVGPHLKGYPNPTTTEPAPNPNLDTINNLPPDQKVAYLAALTGRSPANGPNQPITETELVNAADIGGCLGQAQQQGANQTRFYQDFGNELAELRQQILNDPQAIQHHQTINDCVTNQGQTYIQPHNLYTHYAPELTTINNTLTPTPDTPQPELNAEAKARLITLQQQETTLATLTYDCGGDPQTTNTLYTKIAQQYEQQFLDQHKDQLDQYRTP